MNKNSICNTSRNPHSSKCLSILRNFTIALSLVCVAFNSHAQVSFINNCQQLNNLAGRGVALADFNGDDALDAFVVNESGPDGKDNRLYFGDGHGQFLDSGLRLPNIYNSDTKPSACDINNDGAMDALVGRVIWFNNNDGTFTVDSLRFMDTDNASFMHLRLADVNNDGFADAFVIIFKGSATEGRIYLNDGNGYFQYTQRPIQLSIIGAGEFGDVNNDGYVDLVVSGWRNTSGAPCPNRVLLNAPLALCGIGRSRWRQRF